MRTKVSVWVHETPRYEWVLRGVVTIVAIALLLSLAIALVSALWQSGALGGVVIGFTLCRFLQG